ncbi:MULTISPECIES: hypothetical protein [unclassified Streptomyces]|uniref:hypothetical protein n=1 Tax=unclassified Streptomyces TaxID=2593676 RepID=UPI002E301354|nr:hypothetical protein [Streptomyces sp. NBC_01361]
MSAREPAESCPPVTTDDDAMEATLHMWGPEASAMQIAALMSRTHSPLVAVVEHDGNRTELVGAVTAARLMEHLIGGP